jgi:hypothetical protein
MAKTETVREVGPPQGVTIVGMRIVGHDREVFVTDASQGTQQRRLRVGDQVAGYTVKSIEAATVTLVSPSGDPVGMPLTLEKGKTAAPAKPGAPGRPSPAAGVTANAVPGAASPAAGVPVAPPAPPPGAKPAVAVPPKPATNPKVQQLPPEVRQKLDQLKQNDASSRMGRKR